MRSTRPQVLIAATSLIAIVFEGYGLLRGQQLAHVNPATEEGVPAATRESTPPLPEVLSTHSLTTTVQVDARTQLVRDGQPVPLHVTQSEVLSSAGTWGDFTRYLQLLPGVVWTNDYSNEVRVRGGNPDENLFVVDGIEIPNINHLALEGTSGGFTSMLDTSAIESVDMKAGVYNPSFSRRLSSLVEIHTREGIDRPSAHELDAGIAGVGGLLQQPLAKQASLLLSAHRSVLSLATDDIGINGVPTYTNGFARAEWMQGSNQRLSLLNLSGADSIKMTPQPCDAGVTSPFRTEYGGVRSTTGLEWQRFVNLKSISTFTLSYSSQDQNIGQQWQTVTQTKNCLSYPVQETPVYSEQTHNGIGTLSYRFVIERGEWIYSIGTTARLTNLNYAVTQPQGAPSPFNSNPIWTDSDEFSYNLTTGESAAFLEAKGRLSTRWTAAAAIREETFALTGARFLNSQGSLALRASEHQSFNLSFARSAQLAPAINILSYPENRRLDPIQADQLSGAAELWRGDKATISIEGYQKRYSHEPVSTEYRSLMLANMIDTLGQQFVWLPLRSEGRGLSEGIELMVRAHSANSFRILGTVSYSKTRYAAADGIMRPGNFDFPLVVNVIGNVRLPWRVELSARNSYASGRPYTPFNIPLSEEQSRGIYDLNRINALRAPAYNRLDLDINRDFHLRTGVVNVHAGVENALDRENFLGYIWMNNCHPRPTDTRCALIPMVIPGVPETQVSQMPIFPSVWLHYRF
jgi:TonB-dependent Receptor Plug Domain